MAEPVSEEDRKRVNAAIGLALFAKNVKEFQAAVRDGHGPLDVAKRFGTLEEYQADADRYQSKRDECLAAGLPEDHPLVRLWTRRLATVQRIIELWKEPK